MIERPLVSGACFDATGRYRYRLWRTWADGPIVCFVMLNPSQADETRDDPTIRRCVGFARDWGYAGLEVVNLFAYRTPLPAELALVNEPVGEGNDWHVMAAAARAAKIVVAWGNAGARFGRANEVLARLRTRRCECLGLTKLRQPRHPLYLGRRVPLTPWPAHVMTSPSRSGATASNRDCPPRPVSPRRTARCSCEAI